ncbi:helix-turn-helix domain-containing protein [Fulvivirga lutea]|uniref:Helix-turn-helix transcriptional regulator n=1 Tax=Fulvivirga lutea TaxID=2810512 RepID=A0A974WKN5_9BACT|nr:AraC family transcriptional regulator [Fulvivirga lutea]QSE98957.1 helix-turn-helix transcriptional regulator [Fulvivirga lutea]
MIGLSEGKYFGSSSEYLETEHFIFSITNHNPHHHIDDHYHDNPYLSVLLSGSYSELNGTDNTLVNPGDILFRPEAYTHKNTFNEKPGKCFNIEFKKQNGKSNMTEMSSPNTFLQFKTSQQKSIYQLIVNFKIHQNPDAAEEYMFDWLNEFSTDCNQLHTQSINKAIKILDSETDQFHRLNDIADRVCIHPVYLSRLFKQKTGKTISEYQLNSKVQQAVKLLLNTKYSISRVSQELAFFDDAHFIKSFKAILGLPPHQFRLALKS